MCKIVYNNNVDIDPLVIIRICSRRYSHKIDVTESR